MASEFDWLYDYIATFLRSPPWTVPLNTFIDEVSLPFYPINQSLIHFVIDVMILLLVVELYHL
jgi:hypothetical protein